MDKKVFVGALASLLMLSSASFLGDAPPRVRADAYFPQTKQGLWGPFETYWQARGGLAQFGMPRTGVFPAGKGYDAQWFERGLFTYNPANPDPYKVELDLLGNAVTEGRRGEAPFKTAISLAGGQFFPQTGHNLSAKFLQHWSATGGLPVYGYPISEPFTEKSRSDGKEYLVQYFERNRFELHPEMAGTPFEVQLGLLGSELLDAHGGPQAFANLGQANFYPRATGIAVPPGQIVESPGAGTPGPNPPRTVPPAPLLPAASRPVLFSDDFASPDLAAWRATARPGSTDVRAAQWSVRDGLLAQSSIFSEDGTDEEAFLLTQQAALGDFTLDLYFYATSGEPVGVVLRATDAGYYILKLYGSAPNNVSKAQLSLVTKEKSTVIGEATSWEGYKLGSWQRLTVAAVGGSFAASIDGQPLLQAKDPTYKAGAIGLYTYADGSARFDNVRVTAP